MEKECGSQTFKVEDGKVELWMEDENILEVKFVSLEGQQFGGSRMFDDDPKKLASIVMKKPLAVRKVKASSLPSLLDVLFLFYC